jgi:putative Holliday junction resolvase
MKVMALDYGSVRTGVAVSDPTGTIARPLCVVERAHSDLGLERLAELVDAESAEQVVVGLPLTLRGERGGQARASEQFAARLRKHLKVPVVLFDERFTTDLAQQAPSSDADLDARAAAHLLSGYLVWSSAGSQA